VMVINEDLVSKMCIRWI